MEFFENHLYHIYNRGNNKQQIFFKKENYIYFLHKVRRFVLPNCEILAYCLISNHFHFLIYSDKRTVESKIISGNKRNVLSEGIRNLLQTYTKAINKQNSTTGSLFQQNTKSKCLSDGSISYATTCFNYIHQNPYNLGLTETLEDWNYSSFKDYAGLRNGTLCNKQLALELLDLNLSTFYNDSYKIIDETKLKKIL